MPTKSKRRFDWLDLWPAVFLPVGIALGLSIRGIGEQPRQVWSTNYVTVTNTVLNLAWRFLPNNTNATMLVATRTNLYPAEVMTVTEIVTNIIGEGIEYSAVTGRTNVLHQHAFGPWSEPLQVSGDYIIPQWYRWRECTNCGQTEMRKVR